MSSKPVKKKVISEPVQVQPVSQKKFFGWALIIFIAAFALYANTFHHGWVLDDYGSFKLNIYVTAGTDGYHDILTKTYRHGSGFYTDNLYRPLSQLMFATEWQFFPDSPGLYHAISVFFYALSCVLLFAFLKRLLKKYNRWIPFFIALLFAAHPIHTEVVANIKSRDEIMCFFFIILTLYFSLLYVDKQKWYFLPLMFVSFFLAMFSKESAITTLTLLPVTLFFFRKPKIKEYVFSFLVILIPAIIYLYVRQSILVNYPESEFFHVDPVDNYFFNEDLFTGWATAIMLLGQYLIKLFVPYKLVCDYSLSQFPITTFADISTWISLVIHLALLVYAILGIKKKKPVAYAIFFYIITMSIYSNLIYRIGSSFAERFLFLPTLGFCVALVFLFFKIFKINDEKTESAKLKFPVMALLVLVLVLYSARTVTRAAEWKDQFTLFGKDVQKSDKSAHMRLYWGLALRDKGEEYADANIKEKNWIKVQENDKQYLDWTWKAIEQFKKGVEIYPKYADCYEQLGLLYDNIGIKINNMTYRDTAEQYYLQCLKLVPNKATANSNLAKIYFERGDIMKAKFYYKTAILYDPLLSDGYFNLGSTYGMLAMYDSSFYYYRKCLEIAPNRTDAVLYMGLNYFNIGKTDSALIYYDKAIQMDPYLYSSYVLKTKALMLSNRWDEGEAVIDKAISMFPYQGELYYYKGLADKNKADFAAALADMNKCIQYQQNFLEAYREKGDLFNRLGQRDSAGYYFNFVQQIEAQMR
ncbi:MAG: glycosyltransferase family 39 protein [Bacteroidales bacterium]|nr:glycosyltransferase family 39 protein [Bacteroidales bacterium]